MIFWHAFGAIRGIIVGVFLTEYRKRRYSRKSSSKHDESQGSAWDRFDTR